MRLLCAPWPNTHLKSTASDKEGPHQNNLDPKTYAWAQYWEEFLSSSLPEKNKTAFGRYLRPGRSVWVRHLNLRHCHEQHWEESHQGIAIKQNKAIVISFWPGTNNPSSITTVLVLLTPAPIPAAMGAPPPLLHLLLLLLLLVLPPHCYCYYLIWKLHFNKARKQT